MTRAVVCLPTRNERQSIEAMINEVRSLGLDLFISDEHSDDGTQEIAMRLGVCFFQWFPKRPGDSSPHYWRSGVTQQTPKLSKHPISDESWKLVYNQAKGRDCT